MRLTVRHTAGRTLTRLSRSTVRASLGVALAALQPAVAMPSVTENIAMQTGPAITPASGGHGASDTSTEPNGAAPQPDFILVGPGWG
jgi:hypothetical protein